METSNEVWLPDGNTGGGIWSDVRVEDNRVLGIFQTALKPSEEYSEENDDLFEGDGADLTPEAAELERVCDVIRSSVIGQESAIRVTASSVLEYIQLLQRPKIAVDTHTRSATNVLIVGRDYSIRACVLV